MKISGLFTAILIILFFTSSPAQDMQVYKMIGKKLSSVTKKYGKPIHQDKSNPAMECIFYKKKNYQMIFVSNKSGVYQTDGWKSFGNKSSAESELNKLIKSCQKDGFTVDTVNVAEYNLKKPGIRLNLSFYENSFSKKYEIKLKANKCES